MSNVILLTCTAHPESKFLQNQKCQECLQEKIDGLEFALKQSKKQLEVLKIAVRDALQDSENMVGVFMTDDQFDQLVSLSKED